MLNPEAIIADYIESFRPEIKERFVYRFEDASDTKYAECSRMVKPRLLTFYVDRIRADYHTEGEIKELVNHEVLHALGWNHGEDFYEKVKTAHFTC